MSKTALIVEDNDDVRLVLRELLEHHGLEVREATNGTTAQRLIGENSFDLIVMDIQLPGLNGLELLLELKSKENSTPTIAISGVPLHLQNAKAFGADWCLPKPLSPADFLEKVDDAIA